jgi:hypothetical protein
VISDGAVFGVEFSVGGFNVKGKSSKCGREVDGKIYCVRRITSAGGEPVSRVCGGQARATCEYYMLLPVPSSIL